MSEREGAARTATRNVMGICLLVGAFAATTSSLQAPQGSPAPADILTATVGLVDTEERRLDVITGIGHALRVVRMQVDPAGVVTVAGAASRLGDLQRGDLVRIRYRMAPGGRVATTIEIIRQPDGRKP